MDLSQEKENGNRLICPFGQTVTWQETAAAEKKLAPAYSKEDLIFTASDIIWWDWKVNKADDSQRPQK